MNFWDTSAFIEAQDALSPVYGRAAGLLRQKTLHSSSVLILPETVATLTRRLKPDNAAIDAACQRAKSVLAGFNLAPVSAEVIEASMEIARRHGLRGADAVHLATALRVVKEGGKRGFVFVTLDLEQATAARSRGLKTVLAR